MNWQYLIAEKSELKTKFAKASKVFSRIFERLLIY